MQIKRAVNTNQVVNELPQDKFFGRIRVRFLGGTNFYHALFTLLPIPELRINKTPFIGGTGGLTHTILKKKNTV
jgi:hypothetical protein